MEEIAMFYYYLLLPLLLLIVLKFYKSTFRRKNLPPSPRPSLPIIGHLHLLKLGDPLHRTFHNLAQTYGPIISLKFGSRLVVVVSSFSAAEECFTKNDILLANRPHFIVGKHLGYNNTTLVQSPYGDHWRNLRRISTIEILSTHRLNMLLGIRKDEIKRLILKLASIPENTTELQSLSSGFAKVEMKKLFQELTFNIMMRMVAGKRYYGDDVTDEEARQFREIINEAVRFGGASNPGDYLPILNWIDGGDFEKRVIKMAKRTDSFLQKLVDEGRRKRKELENTDNMIDHLLSLQESQPEYYTDEVIKGLVLNMLLAGTDTSSVTLEWAMSNLLNHPETLRTVKDEIDCHVGQEVLIDEPHISRLHYLQNIITETLRLYPAAPLLVPHMSSNDCTISGYTVPRDAILLVNAWTIHRDPKVWNDAASFKPERFEKVENEAHNKTMPFGLGRRSCPGAGLAQRVVSLTLGSMIQCFEWEMVPGEKEIDMTEVRGGIVMHKQKALETTCRARPIVNKIFGTSS